MLNLTDNFACHHSLVCHLTKKYVVYSHNIRTVRQAKFNVIVIFGHV